MWKKYNDIYSVSSLGDVRNDRTNKVLKHQLNSKGYIRIVIGPKKYLVHRLVGKLFVPNPLNKPQINHIDGDKLNNTYTNLEWMTNLENSRHAFRNGRQSGRTKLSVSQVKNILSSNMKASELAELYNVKTVTIYAVRNGRNTKRLSL